jgi:S1-C subfamily serine protease
LVALALAVTLPLATGAASVPPHPAATPLPAAEQNTIDVFKRVSPSVVSVANMAVLQDFYDAQVYEVPRGAGTGFIWDKEGHLVSNFHVVYGASAIQVTLHDGATYPAMIVGLDPDDDIAVLKIEAPREKLVPIQPGRSTTLQVGQTALAIGNPFGLDTSLSVGVVSALGRTIMSMNQRQIRNVIQTDAAINPGNSGGPLLDSAGRLIGMNTAIVSPSGAYAGIGFAVPVDIILRAVPQLIKTGKVLRPTLGVRMAPAELLNRFRAREGRGVVIHSIVENSPADQAGLRGIRRTRRGEFVFGDVILKIGDAEVNSPDELAAAIDRQQIGDSVVLTVHRDGARRTVSVRLTGAGE